MPKEKYTFIDLFGGLDGFHIALSKLGCRCEMMVFQQINVNLCVPFIPSK